jgi:hypothetical protein
MATKTKFELYILQGCEKCVRIKYAVVAEDLLFEEINCTSSENKKCDSLEDKIDCGRYPMAVIKNNGVTTIIHFCDFKKPSGESIKRIPVDSEDRFIQEIKKAYF